MGLRQLEPFPTGLLASGGSRKSGADRPLIDRGRVVRLAIALGEPDEGLERRRMRRRIADLPGG
jgi:hypothetical protein